MVLVHITKYVLRIAIFILCLSAVGVTLSAGGGRFIPSDRFMAVGGPTAHQPPQFFYLLDANRLLKMRVYLPFDPKTVVNIRERWDQPEQVYLWQRVREASSGDNATVLYLLDVLTGQFERLIDTRETALDVIVPTQENPYLSPNGRYLAFGRWATGDIYILDRESDEIHQVLGLSDRLPRAQEAALGHSAPNWSPNSERIVFWHNGVLFILSAEGDDPLEINLSGKVVHYGLWTEDSQTVLLSSYTPDFGLVPIRYDIAANRLDFMDETEPPSRTAMWDCNERWLTYLVPRETDPNTNLPVGDFPLFAGFIRDMEREEVLELDTILPAESQNVLYIRSLTCGEYPLMLIGGQVSKEAAEASSYPTLSLGSQSLMLFDTGTKTVIPLTTAGWFQRWDEATQTLIYAADEGNNVRKLYKRSSDLDAEAVEIGTYSYNSDDFDTNFSSDYRYMVVIEEIPQITFDGRLRRVDLQTGEHVYLTGPDVLIESVISIPWD